MIQLQDINAGDTIQGMVQKINYNFDQIQANGGGPRGVQGERGERGEMGPRGARGLQGERGCAWFAMDGDRGIPQTPMIEPQENDLGIDENGYVWIYVVDGGMSHWEVTDFNITSALDSPFAVRGSVGAIVEKSDFSEYYLTFGSTFNGITERSIETKPSIVICNNTMGEAHPHTDGIEFYRDFVHTDYFSGRISVNYDGDRAILDIHSDGDTRLSSSDGVDRNSLVVEGGRKLKWTPLAGSTGSTDIKPLLVGDNNGYISTWASDDQTKWKWGFIKYVDSFDWNIMIPNNNSLSSLGWFDNQVNTIFLGNGSFAGMIRVPDYSDTGVFVFNVCDDAETHLATHGNGAVAGNFVTLGSLGLNHINRKRGGMNIRDTKSYGGCLSLDGMNDASPDYITGAMGEKTMYYDSNMNVVCTGRVNMTQAYKDNLPKGSQYGCSPLITLNTSGNSTSSKLTNQLNIEGGKYGNSVLVSGGREYNEKAGGDVYIAGGSVLSQDPEAVANYNRSNIYLPMYFGDVVVGVNPNNHKDYYATARGEDVAVRGANDAKSGQTLDFYDINNFTAHANNIWLDSNAQDRAFRGNDQTYYANPLYFAPSLSSYKNITLNMGGLCTLHHGKPIIVTHDDLYKYQMVSGKFCYIIEKYLDADGNIVSNMFSRSIRNHQPPNGAFCSLVSTDWTKVGNVVQCSTRINNYYYYNGYRILEGSANLANYCPLFGTTPLRGYANVNLYSSIYLPIVCAIPYSSDLNACMVGSLNGTGTFFTESKTTPSDKFFSEPTTAMFSYSESALSNGFGNLTRHNSNGGMSDVNSNPIFPIGDTNDWAIDFAGNEGWVSAVYNSQYPAGDTLYITLSDWLINIDGKNIITFFIPSYTKPISNGGKVMTVVDKLYTSATLNYSYILNPRFLFNDHVPFRRNNADKETETVFANSIFSYVPLGTGSASNGNGGSSSGSGSGSGSGGTGYMPSVDEIADASDTGGKILPSIVDIANRGTSSGLSKEFASVNAKLNTK